MIYKKIDGTSPNSITSALDLFTVAPTNISFANSYYREILTLNPVTQFPFHWKIHPGSSFIDLSKCYFLTEFQILKPNGAKVAPTDEVGTIQLLGSTFMRNLRVSLNGREVYSGNQLTAYKAFFDNLLSFGSESKNAHLTESGYFEYDNDDTTKNNGIITNRSMFSNSKKVQFISKVHADIFNQNLLLLNGIEMDIEVTPASDDFCLFKDGTEIFRLDILSCKFYVKYCDLVDSLSLSFNTQLLSEPAKYSVRRTEIKNMIITAGRTDFHANLFSEQIPRRLVLAMNTVSDFNGNSKTDPFDFKPFNLRELTISAGGNDYPSVNYDLSFTDYRFTRAYHDMIEAMGFGFSDKSNAITLENFKSGKTIFVFDLTTASDNSFSLIRNGATNLNMKFTTGTPIGGVNLLIYAEFDGLILIDSNRIVNSDITI